MGLRGYRTWSSATRWAWESKSRGRALLEEVMGGSADLPAGAGVGILDSFTLAAQSAWFVGCAIAMVDQFSGR
jgi:hypothetical protein